MRSFQGVVSMWTSEYSEIFKSALVYLYPARNLAIIVKTKGEIKNKITGRECFFFFFFFDKLKY